MKKLIKDWWPLLVIVAIVLWKRHEKKAVAEPTLSQEQATADYIRQLEKAGYVKAGKCPLCGSDLYKMYYHTAYDSNLGPYGPLGTSVAQACVNPNCENFDERFVLDY